MILVPRISDPDADPKESLGITSVEAEELVKQAVGYKPGRDQIQVSIGKRTELETDVAEDSPLPPAKVGRITSSSQRQSPY